MLDLFSKDDGQKDDRNQAALPRARQEEMAAEKQGGGRKGELQEARVHQRRPQTARVEPPEMCDVESVGDDVAKPPLARSAANVYCRPHCAK